MKTKLDLSSLTDEELAAIEEAARTARSIASDDRTATTAPSSVRTAVPTVPQPPSSVRTSVPTVPQTRFALTQFAPDSFSTFFADPAHNELYDASDPPSSKFLHIAT
eukprot:4265870-Ditylum_brightwellii.AAC.1